MKLDKTTLEMLEDILLLGKKQGFEVFCTGENIVLKRDNKIMYKNSVELTYMFLI